MVHLPVLRRGEPYTSLNTNLLTDIRTGEPVAEVSLANPGLIARDLARVGEARRRLESFSTAELVEISGRAGLHPGPHLPGIHGEPHGLKQESPCRKRWPPRT